VSGFWYGVAAYGIWGLFPLYWKLVQHVPALQILGHRIVWSFAALAVLTTFSRDISAPSLWRAPRRVIGMYAIAAVLIGINSFLYVYAVNAGFIVETSLGYFIAPLVNVVLGVLVFRERLRAGQWIAVALAAAGVAYLTRAYGAVPWIAAGLATSFGSYGLVKKKAPLDSLRGLTLETAVLVIPAAAFLAAVQANGRGAFLHTGVASDLLLVGGGLVTIGPLLLFASAVRRIPLSVIGLLQYIAPTIQFLLGVFLYHEPFSRTQLIGFTVVWIALLVFSVDGLRARGVPGRVAVLDDGRPA
jgi:chloramphenicol-sensitive protein RarD